MNFAQAQAAHPAITANTPAWLAQNIKTFQAQADASYASRLAQWQQDREQWISTQTVARGNGLPITSPPAIPTHDYIFDSGDGFNYTIIPTTDDSLSLPTLPPQLPAGTPGGPVASISFSSGANNFNAQLLGMTQATFSLAQQIAADLALIKAALKITG